MDDEGLEISSNLLQSIQSAQEKGQGAILVALDSVVQGYFIFEDSVKPEAKKVIEELKSQGITTVMLTGDNEATAKEIARQVGVDLVFADVLPEGKLERIKSLGADGKVVFVGDGINDALPLKQADIGIALRSGSDIAKDAGDIILIGSDLGLVNSALRLSRATMRIVKQNLFWAFIYNIIGIPLAAGVLYPAFGLLLTPKYAGMAMSISSVTVVLNALRLKWAKF
jgi:Cu+-exporting ATPase